MDARLPNQTRSLPAVILSVLLGVIATVFFVVLFNTPSAFAADNTSCGQAVCYVDSTVIAESDWASRPYVSDPKGIGTPAFIRKYSPCDTWNKYITTYPIASMTCFFSDQIDNSTCYPKNNRSPNGKVDYYIQEIKPDGSKEWVFARSKCLYPTDPYAPFPYKKGEGKVYTGGQTDFYLTGSASDATKATRTGLKTDTSGYVSRSVNLSNPENYTGAWSVSLKAKTGVSASGQPLFGYYRLLSSLDYRICEKWAYPSWLNKPEWADCSRQGQDNFVSPYTYACNLTPPLQAGIKTGALFNASACANKWVCSVSPDTLVAGSSSSITVMRNGEHIAVKYPTTSLTGDGYRNPRNWQFLNQIKQGSTPFVRGLPSNSPQQLFSASHTWDSWQTYNPDGWVAFNWASDSNSGGFSWTTNYRFTADFYVPTQTAIGDAPQYAWVADRANCGSSETAVIKVIRAVNTP